MATATWIRDSLAKRGVDFEELHHDEVYTAQQMAQCEHVTGHRVAKVVVVMADGRPFEVVLPASRRLDLQRAKEFLRAGECRLATEQELSKHFIDCEVGAMPALRHWQGVDVLMDFSMKVHGDIVFHGGTHCDAVRMNFDDWFDMVSPRVGSFTDPIGSGPRRASFDDQADS